MKADRLACLVVLVIGSAISGSICRADDVQTVTINTAPLEGSSTTFALAFALNDGGQTGNNTVSVSDFSLGGGSLASTAVGVSPDCSAGYFTCGGVSGEIDAADPSGSVVTLSDTGLYNGLVQEFTPGNTLSFTFDATTNPDVCSGCADDTFVFQILSPCASTADACSNLQTTDSLFSSFVTVDLAQDQVSTFSSNPNGLYPDIVATSTPVLTTTPEPSAVVLYGLGLLLMCGLLIGQKCHRTM